MKRNIVILVGLIIIVGGAYMYSKREKVTEVKNEVKQEVTTEASMKSITGDVVRVFKGEQKLEYSLSIPETASTSLDMNKALLRITDGGKLLATVYFSFEGQRGYSASKYIDDVIAPQVQVITPVGEAMIGNTMWYKGASDVSEWHIATISGGKWLVVVESKKADSQIAQKILSSFSVK